MTRNYILCPTCFGLVRDKRLGGETCFDENFVKGFCDKCRKGVAEYVKSNPPDASGHEHDPHREAEIFNKRRVK